MGLKIGTERVGGIKIGTEMVEVAKIGTEIAFRAETVTVFEWSGALIKAAGFVGSPRTNTQLPTEWFENGATAYVGRHRTLRSTPILRGSNGHVTLQFQPDLVESASEPGPQLTSAAESGLRIEMIHATAGTLVIIGTGSDTSEPYGWVPTNSAEVIAWYNAVSNNDNVRVRFSL